MKINANYPSAWSVRQRDSQQSENNSADMPYVDTTEQQDKIKSVEQTEKNDLNQQDNPSADRDIRIANNALGTLLDIRV